MNAARSPFKAYTACTYKTLQHIYRPMYISKCKINVRSISLIKLKELIKSILKSGRRTMIL